MEAKIGEPYTNQYNMYQGFMNSDLSSDKNDNFF